MGHKSQTPDITWSSYLERQGLLVRDGESTYLTADGVGPDNETPMNHLFGSSITYRIATGPQQGRKVFTLQTLPGCGDEQLASRVGKVAGFSLHAGVAARANERDKLERLCRYIARPAVSTKRLSMTRNGQVRYELKTPYANGTTHIIFEPLDFMFRTNGMPRAQEAQERPSPGLSLWFPSPELTSLVSMVSSPPTVNTACR